MPALPAPSAAALSVARKLAAAHPGAKLPCPLCATTLRADNFEKHLGKTHPAHVHADAAAASVTFIGVDRRIRAVTVPLPIAWALAVAVVAGAHAPLDARGAALLVGSLVAVVVPLLLAEFGAFRARLTLAGDTLRLRHTLGLRTALVKLPAPLTVGPLRGRKPTAVLSAYSADLPEGHASEETTVGTYLQIGPDRAAITIGCPKKSGFRQHWDPHGWRPGPQRRAWDITLDRESLVALEYQLAARALLAPHASPHDRP